MTRLHRLLALLCLLPIGLPTAADTVKVGQRAPDFRARSITGKTIRLSSLHGKVIVLDFWTTT